MRRALWSLLALGLAAVPAKAHFVFLLPDDKGNVRMVFSDGLEPDENADLLDKIKQTELFAVGARGVVTPVKFAKDKDAFAVNAGDAKPVVVFGTCKYGVFQRGEAPASLLTYYTKALVGPPADALKACEKAAEKLDLAICPTKTPQVYKVTWKGKGLPDAAVTVMGKNRRTAKTDGDGTLSLQDAKFEGLVGLRVSHTVKEEGEYDGKKYTQSRHWATLVFNASPAKPGAAPAPEKDSKDSPVSELKENAEATKLLADARAARANWENFPGFTADLEINVEGNVHKGKLDVDGKGKVKLEGFEDKAVETWAKRQLSSVVGHRMAGEALNTPCAFVANDAHHPLGRAIQVLNDEFHSSYRIRDRQVIVVNRTMKDTRFTITVLENKVNAEKQFLPSHYVVNSWNLKSDALVSSETFFHEWTRHSKYDLPGSTTIVKATTDGKLEARQVRLTNHKLK